MKKIITLVIILILLIASVIYKASTYNPFHITIRTEKISSNKISSELDGTKIVYFSDLHFGNYTNQNELNTCVDLINKLDPDVVVFGGDLIDNFSTTNITQEQKQQITNSLKTIKASQGKFYILGNHDLESEKSKEEILNILEYADFSSLINKNIQIHNGSNSFFNIVGLDSLLEGNPNLSDAYSNVDDSRYTLSFVHCPDLFSELPLDKTDYVIAGHSHGGQIYIPLFDNLYRASGCKKYFYGKHNKNATTLDISNGVGITNYCFRLFAPAEIVFYKLSSN